MTKAEQKRLTNWRSKILLRAADTRCVARTCRHYGLSRKTFYKWHRRFSDHGAAGLCDRPSRPHRSPRATPGYLPWGSGDESRFRYRANATRFGLVCPL
jgi:hypothetical protein